MSSNEFDDNDQKKNNRLFTRDSDDISFEMVVTNNWRYGLCKHKVIFEATETVKKMRFFGDLLGKLDKIVYI